MCILQYISLKWRNFCFKSTLVPLRYDSKVTTQTKYIRNKSLKPIDVAVKFLLQAVNPQATLHVIAKTESLT